MKPQESEVKPDLLKRAKHVGYHWSNMSPVNETSFLDFLDYAKFQLCVKTHRLMKDPIWDNYNDIELLAEYFAWVYSESKEQRETLEQEMGASEDMYDWFDRMIGENQKELEKVNSELPDDLDFDPVSVLGE